MKPSDPLALALLVAASLLAACGGASTPAPSGPSAPPGQVETPAPAASSVAVAEPAPAEAPPEEAEPGPTQAGVMGALHGDDPDSAGYGGLGLRGMGPGGGGTGEGIGLGSIGRLGRGAGSGSGYGAGPRVKAGPDASVAGSLPKEVIRRVVRRGQGEVRRCYEAGLAKKPDLRGRVVVLFEIGKDGSVTSAERAGGDLPDDAVASCVARAFAKLRFPAPEGGGVVRVKYPLDFRPSEDPAPNPAP